MKNNKKKKINNPNNSEKSFFSSFLFFFFFTDIDTDKPKILTIPSILKLVSKEEIVKTTIIKEDKVTINEKIKETKEVIAPVIIIIPSKDSKELKNNANNIISITKEEPELNQSEKKQEEQKPILEIKTISEDKSLSIKYINNLNEIVNEDLKLCIQIEDELHEINQDLEKLSNKKNLKDEQIELDHLLEKIQLLKEKCKSLIDNYGFSIDIPDYNVVKNEKEKEDKTDKVINYLKYIEELHANLNEELKFRQELLIQKQHEIEKIRIDKNYLSFINEITNNIIKDQSISINNMKKDLGKIDNETTTKTKLIMNFNKLINPIIFLDSLSDANQMDVNPLNLFFATACLGLSVKHLFRLFEWKTFKNTKTIFHDFTKEIRKDIYTINDSIKTINISLLDIKDLKKRLSNKDYQDLKVNKSYKDLIKKLDILEIDLNNKKEQLKKLEKDLEEKQRTNDKSKIKYKEMIRKK